MKLIVRGIVVLVMTSSLTVPAIGGAFACPSDVTIASRPPGTAQHVQIVACQAQSGTTDEARGAVTGTPSAGGQVAFLEYRWSSVCVAFVSETVRSEWPDCKAAQHCQDPARRVWELWALKRSPREWVWLGSECLGAPPEVVPQRPSRRMVTPGLVLRAVERIGLPGLLVRTQPEGKTLVNLETIFYTEPETVTRTVRLLGQDVTVQATPTGYTWHHGDGTTAATDSPGAPCPSMENTHAYLEAYVTLAPSVDATYTARFRVNDGPWQDIDQTITVDGPSISLRIAEATPVLSGDY